MAPAEGEQMLYAARGQKAGYDDPTVDIHAFSCSP
jgi:hypothetical protein